MAWDTTVFSGAPVDGRLGLDGSQWTVATGSAKAAGGARTATPSIAEQALGPAAATTATYGTTAGGGLAMSPLVILGGAAVLAVVLLKRKKG